MFLNFLSFKILKPQEPRNFLKVLIVGYCIISRCNGMFFEMVKSRIYAIFEKKLQFFQVFFCFYLFPAPGAHGPPPVFNNKQLHGV